MLSASMPISGQPTNANNVADPGQAPNMYSPHVDSSILPQQQPGGFGAIDAEDGAYANPPVNENPPPPAPSQVQSPYPPEPQNVEPSAIVDTLPFQSPPDVVPSVSAHFMPPEDPSGMMNPQQLQQQQQQQINSSQPEVLQQIPSNLQNFGQPPMLQHQHQSQDPEIVSQAVVGHAQVDSPQQPLDIPQPQQPPAGQQQLFDQQQQQGQQGISVPGTLSVQQQLTPPSSSLSQGLNLGPSSQVQHPQHQQQQFLPPQPQFAPNQQQLQTVPSQQHVPMASQSGTSLNQQPTAFIPPQHTVETASPNQQQQPFQPIAATSPSVPMQAPLYVQQPGFYQAPPTSSASAFSPVQEIQQQQQGQHNTLSPQTSNTSVNSVISTDGGFHMQQPNLSVIGQQQQTNQQIPSLVNAPPAVTAASVEADDPETAEETSAINELFGRSAPKPKQSPPPSFDQQLVAALESHQQQQQTSSGNLSLSLSPGNSMQPSAETHLPPAQISQPAILNQSSSALPVNNSYQETMQTNGNNALAKFPQQHQVSTSQHQPLAAQPQQQAMTEQPGVYQPPPQQQQQQQVSPQQGVIAASPQPIIPQQQQVVSPSPQPMFPQQQQLETASQQPPQRPQPTLPQSVLQQQQQPGQQFVTPQQQLQPVQPQQMTSALGQYPGMQPQMPMYGNQYPMAQPQTQQAMSQEQQNQIAQYYQQMGYTPEQVQAIMQQYQYNPSMGGMGAYGGAPGAGADYYSQMWYHQQQQYMEQMYYYNYWSAMNSYPSSAASSHFGDSRPGSVIERRSSRSSDQVLSELGDLTSELSFPNKSGESPLFVLLLFF